MNAYIRGNRDLIKQMNRNLLLNILRREGQLSRKQLTEMSGLSVGSVSGLVAELMAQKWLIELGEGDFTGGRRQTMIKLNPRAGYAMGIKLMENRAIIAITDFESTILEYYDRPILPEPDRRKIVDQLVAAIQSVLDESHIELDRLFGIGIGLAGVVNSKEGLIHYSPFFGWREFSLAQALEQKIDYPVYVENDVNTLTLTEQLFGVGSHVENFVVITVGRGIGLGIVINNQLYNGIRGGAGEFGHMVVWDKNNLDDPFAYVTIEEIAADPAIVAKMAAFQEDGCVITDLRDVVAQASAGNKKAIELLAESGTQIGAGVANVINLLNPELIIISGEGTIAGDFRHKPLVDAIQRYTFDGLLEGVEIVVEPTDDRAWARGAASLVISKVFESPIVEGSFI
ncbi:ROK family transcriptional regulator [Anaerolineales bacterium]